ncbi:MAG: hypothetical protein JRI68_08350, partial [Deltaproteobacteria bacterium]|nr:hypothetical protein [Deltaproteobacteria bacterium]
VLHCAREALRDAGQAELGAAADSRLGERRGVILGNLSYPTQSLSRYAESVWLGAQGPNVGGGRPLGALAGVRPPAPINRFMSGLPALLCARAFGLGAAAFALDAACASSLYAIKLACDELHAGRADLMLAGGVNRADDLFIHVGFCALRAMSQTGRSRPFHRRADGLVPAEGAAFVVLKRLADAVASGDPIRGVIRTIGLSNDGRGRGLLVPSQEGQERCLRRAYELCEDLCPEDVSLVECHATGTPVGDVVEVRSMASLFAGGDPTPIGSLKSNLGHLITVSGVAGLLKVLGAMDAGMIPPTLHATELLEELGGSPLRVVTAAEPWETAGGPRRGAINNFGFGGNNAHLVVEQWTGEDGPRRPAVSQPRRAKPPAVAIVGIEALVGNGTGVTELTADLFSGNPRCRAQADGSLAAVADGVELPLTGIRFPPADLDQTLAQQLFVLRALWQLLQQREAEGHAALPRDGTGVLVGMQCDAEVARYGARWRIPEWAARWSQADGGSVDPSWLAEARERIGALRQAAGVVGAMPNIAANRLCSQFDLAGPSFTVSAEELSGLVALDLAVRALQERELDAAVVAAVDLGCEPVHTAAARAVLTGAGQNPGDAAVVLLLKRLDDALADGEPILGVVEPATGEPDWRLGDDDDRLGALFGHAHAAVGLLRVAAAVLACRHRGLPLAATAAGAAALPWLPNPAGGHERLTIEASTTSQLGPTHRCHLKQGPGPVAPLVVDPAVPQITLYAASDLAALRQAVAEDQAAAAESTAPCRLVLVAPAAQRAARLDEARRLLGADTPLAGPVDELAPGLYLSQRPLQGEVAAVFTGPAGAYPGMGREQALAFPELVTELGRSCTRLGEAAAWIYAPERQPAELEPSPHDKLWGSSFLSQLHLQLCRQVLAIEPQAAVGFCSGESNALFAFGAWRDMDAMYDELCAAEVFTRELGGSFAAIERQWRSQGLIGPNQSVRWQNWRLLVPEDQVAAAVAAQPLVHLTIINAPGDVVIGGQAEACEAVVGAVGRHRAYRLGYDVAIHCAEIEGYRDTWRRLHRRQTHPVPDVRFYSCHHGASYEPTADTAADALVGLALHPVDFPRLIRRAWDDGVRVFVELGPRDGCSKWIGQILAGREHLAVALDRSGRSSLHQLVDCAARLLAAGVAVDHEGLAAAIDAAVLPRAPGVPAGVKMRRYPAHPATVLLPPLPGTAADEDAVVAADDDSEWMEPAPWLPPVLEGAATPPTAAVPRCSPDGGVSAPGGFTSSVPAPSTAPAWTGLPAPLREAMAHHERVVAVHQQFLAGQAAVHQQFVVQRQRSLAQLASVATAATAGVPRPSPAVAPAPPPVPTVEPTAGPTVPRGPSFDRPELEILASGSISSVFGPQFAPQDRYERQVRLPLPPLLLVDRVTGIDAEPASMGTGTIWTETDVGADAWYLDDGVMPAGIMVESGQADLLLISWLGVDLVNQGERAYRLLGCDLTYSGRLPRVGDTLCYDIHVDGHAQAGPVRLFFFHYDCRIDGEVCLSVRNGQAGFFTDQELDDSGGILWDPHSPDSQPTTSARVDPPRVTCTRHQLSAAQVQAFADGRVFDCFGPGFELCQTHTRPPKIQSGKLQLIEEVTHLEPGGGPWGRGYLRVTNQLCPDDWYLEGHFKNDPCMPGTLMCEGCVQAMALLLTAMGYTLDKDGWRFEPVGGETYNLRCRGQVTPASRELIYEVFVEELWDGPEPTIIADILGTADGLKIFHGRRMGLRLVPEWPLTSRPDLLAAIDERRQSVATVDGFSFGYASLLACAWGRPSDAFGPTAQVFDGTRHIARLPGPPYHFMSRVTQVEGEKGSMKTGASIELEYDIPPDAWYFDENGRRTMPFCILLEAALQPCGWLAVYIGGPGTTDQDLYFRNLDGSCTQRATLAPDAGTLRTRTRLVSISKVGGVVLVSYQAECLVGDEVVFEMDTGFGFFAKEALAQQVGLAATEAERAWLGEPNDLHLDLTARPARYCDGPLRLPGPMLLMIDRVTGYWAAGGPAGLGRWRAEKTVDVSEWFFKAHFYRDPVQPGSLGLEAMIQLLQLHLLHTEAGADIPNPQFEPLELERPLTWKYRGQVTPQDRRITVELNVLEQGRDEQGACYAVAEAWLWVDQLRIYHATNLGMRIVSGDEPTRAVAPRRFEETIDPAVDRWIEDHRPNYTLPTLPLMSIVDRLAAAALAFVRDEYRWPSAAPDAVAPPADWVIESVQEVKLQGWLTFASPRRIRCEVTPTAVEAAATCVSAVTLTVTLAAWREADSATLSRFEPVATGRVRITRGWSAPPAAWHPPTDAEPEPDPYQTGALFHGPAFQLLRSLRIGGSGSSAMLDAGAVAVPRGALHQALLDGMVHGIPHDDLRRWSETVDAEDLAYPFQVRSARFHGPAPAAGPVRCEARFAGFAGSERFPCFRIQAIAQEQVWATIELIEVLVPMGEHGRDRAQRVTFLRDRQFLPGIGISTFAGEQTRLDFREVATKDWLKGSVAHAYGADPGDLEAVARLAATKDHVAQRAAAHPSTVSVAPDGASAVVPRLPLTCFPVAVDRTDEGVVVTDAGPPSLDLTAVRDAGRRSIGIDGWVGESVSLALCRRFVRQVVLSDPTGFAAQRGQPALYLGNHQVQIESVLLPIVAGGLTDRHVVTIAGIEHQSGWVGTYGEFSCRYPEGHHPPAIIFFDQEDRQSMFTILAQLKQELAAGHSVFVHVEGQLGRACRRPVERISSVFIDLALELGIAIIPVRFAGGLPVEPLSAGIDFPLGYGRQDYYLGRPISAAELSPLPYARRRIQIIEALNELGPALSDEEPQPPDGRYAERVRHWLERCRGHEAKAVIATALEDEVDHLRADIELLLEPAASFPDDAKGRWLGELRRWLFDP